MKALKTPLRYPGGKSRATKYILPRFPKEVSDYREPFIGGGSVAIEFTKRYPGVPVWVNDLYGPLYNFWHNLQRNADIFHDDLLDLKKEYNTPEKAKVLFLEQKDVLDDEEATSYDKGIAFYILNKCSFSGLTAASSFSPQASDNNFTERGIEKLPLYSCIICDWKITNLPYEQLLTDMVRDTHLYCDPPYDIKDDLYGTRGMLHTTFDHDLFAERMDSLTTNTLVSYNASQLVKNRFQGLQWNAYEFSLTYTMRSVGDYMKDQQQRKELILTNY